MRHAVQRIRYLAQQLRPPNVHLAPAWAWLQQSPCEASAQNTVPHLHIAGPLAELQ